MAVGLPLADGVTPKLAAGDPSRSFYRYYAGYSEAFVEDALARLNVDKRCIVLDPWNGTGTTTAVAARLGHRTIGIDRNPVLVAISVARCLPSEEARSILAKLRRSLARVGEISLLGNDPLLTWFAPGFVAAFRGLQAQSLAAVGVGERMAASSFQGAEALVHVLFFRCARRLALRVFGSNPTWISQRRLLRRISCKPAQLIAALKEEIELLDAHFARYPNKRSRAPRILTGDTVRLSEVVKSKVDIVITSPPYGTRIDYGIATAIELACLAGKRSLDSGELRRSLIGTTITSHLLVDAEECWGPACNEFLYNVGAHKSKASSTYYTRYYINYFSQLRKSFLSISSVTKSACDLVMVVQGSFYKELYLDLASISSEMLSDIGWRLTERVDREVKVSFTLLNPDAKRYFKPHRPFESVIHLRR